MPFGAAPKCPLCGKSVYHAEKATGPGGDWHKMCLKCPDCNKLLDSTTVCEHEGLVYCKACYGRRYGPKGTRASMQHCDGDVPPPASSYESPSHSQAPAASGGPKFCSNCGTKFDEAPKFCSSCGTKV